MPTANRWGRASAGAALAVAAGAAAWAMWETPLGRALRHDPGRAAAGVRGFADTHAVACPVAFVAVYLLASVLCVPVWWLQVLAGAAFGLWSGGGMCLAGSAVGAAATAAVADWFAGDWYHTRIESRAARLRWLDRALGQHGLLTVMAVRLTHVVPFGLSNVALGLSDVPTAAVFAGTLFGNVPAVAVYVGMGAGVAGRRAFVAAVVVANAGLLVPIAAVVLRRWWRHGSSPSLTNANGSGVVAAPPVD